MTVMCLMSKDDDRRGQAWAKRPHTVTPCITSLGLSHSLTRHCVCVRAHGTELHLLSVYSE